MTFTAGSNIDYLNLPGQVARRNAYTAGDGKNSRRVGLLGY